jgi:hypothetical protein
VKTISAAIEGDFVAAARNLGRMISTHGAENLQDMSLAWCDTLAEALHLRDYRPGRIVNFQNTDTGSRDQQVPEEVSWAGAVINARFCDDQDGWRLAWEQLGDAGTDWPKYVLALLTNIGITIRGTQP